MTAYYTFICIIAVLGIIQYRYFPKNKMFKLGYIAICGAIFFLLGAFRYGIGYDYFSYLNIFEEIVNLPFTYSALSGYRVELGFTFLVKLITMLTTDGQMIYLIFSAVVVIVVMPVIYRYSEVPFISIFLFLVMNYYFMTISMIRYALATVLVFASYSILRNSTFDWTKKSFSAKIFWKNIFTNFLPYALIIVLAGTIHKSAYIMIPVYFVAKLNLNKITALLYTVATLTLFFASKPLAYIISERFFGGAYNPYKFTGNKYLDMFIQPAGSFYIAVPTIIIISSIVVFKKLIRKNPSNIVLVNMSIYTFVIYFLSAYSLYIFNRVAYFPSMFMMLLIPEIISVVKPNAEDTKRLQEIKQTIKSSGKNEQKRLAKEEKALKESLGDSHIFYIFAICAVLAGGLLHFGIHYNLSSNGVFPYESVSPGFNRINNLNFSNDRSKRANEVFKSNSLDDLMLQMNDPDYIFILTTQIVANEDKSLPMDWQQKRLTDFGLEIMLKEHVGSNYIAVVDGTKAIFEEVGVGKLSKELEIDGHDAEIMVNDDVSSIKIDGVEYSTEKPRINVLVYDKKLEKIIDSVNINPPFQTVSKRYPAYFYTKKDLTVASGTANE